MNRQRIPEKFPFCASLALMNEGKECSIAYKSFENRQVIS